MAKTLIEEFKSHIVYDLSSPEAKELGIETVGIKLDSGLTKAGDVFAIVQRYKGEETYRLAKFYDAFDDIPKGEYGVCDSEHGFEFRRHLRHED